MRQRIMHSRDKVEKALADLGFKSLTSAANFIFTEHPQFAAKDIAQHLRDNNIIVRHFDKPRISNFLRISIGSEEECATMLKYLQQMINQ